MGWNNLDVNREMDRGKMDTAMQTTRMILCRPTVAGQIAVTSRDQFRTD